MREIIEKYFDGSAEFCWKKAAAIYSAMFFVVMFIVMCAFCADGMGPFQFESDGFTYFSRIAYLGEYIRNTLHGIINGTSGVSVYDFRIGIGNDISLLMWVGALNPIVFLTAPFFSIEHTEQLYWLICILHMYISGLSFMLFCSCKNGENAAAACGAAAYVFSGFAIFYFLRQFLFMNGMIILPAMLWSLEKIMNGGKPYFFIFFTAASLLVNFYFFITISMILFVYGLTQFFDIYKYDRIKMFCLIFFKCAGSYLLGVMLAAPLFLPVVDKIMNGVRGEITRDWKLFYSFDEIVNSIVYMFSPGIKWVHGASMIPLGFLALFCFMRTKASSTRGLKLFFLIFFVAHVTPLTTRILSLGTSSPAERRWTFVFAFTLAYILFLMFPRLASWHEKDEKICTAATACYAVLAICLSVFNLGSINLKVLFSVVSIYAVIRCLRYIRERWKPETKRVLLSCLVVFFSIANVYFLYFCGPRELKSTFGDAHKAYQICRNALSAYSVIDKAERVDRTPFFRCDSTKASAWSFYMLADQYDINSYGSLINDYPAYLLELANIKSLHAWSVKGCDEIATLESLLCVKYFTAEKGKELRAPYGFEKIMESDGYSILKNKNFLPLGYTYDSYITQREYEEYTALEKLESQLQSVALENEPSGFPRSLRVKSGAKPVRYRISKLDGVRWKKGELTATKSNASMEIAFKPSPVGTETYLYIQGLKVKSGRSLFTVRIDSSGWSKTFRLYKNAALRYGAEGKFLVRLIPENGSKDRRLKIIWPGKGTFKLEDIQLYAQPMDDYPAQIEKLREDVLENINVGNDRVSGTISLEKNKILCLSIPYSKGWRAKVDGKDAELLKANSLFMALPLKAGDHKIELEYHVPGFRLGLCLFALGAAILCAMIFIDRRKRRQAPQA